MASTLTLFHPPLPYLYIPNLFNSTLWKLKLWNFRESYASLCYVWWRKLKLKRRKFEVVFKKFSPVCAKLGVLSAFFDEFPNNICSVPRKKEHSVTQRGIYFKRKLAWSTFGVVEQSLSADRSSERAVVRENGRTRVARQMCVRACVHTELSAPANRPVAA